MEPRTNRSQLELGTVAYFEDMTEEELKAERDLENAIAGLLMRLIVTLKNSRYADKNFLIFAARPSWSRVSQSQIVRLRQPKRRR